MALGCQSPFSRTERLADNLAALLTDSHYKSEKIRVAIMELVDELK